MNPLLQALLTAHPAVTACFIAGLVLIVYSLKSFIKASIDPRRSIVVITGCDSGFGQLTVNLLSPLGYIVVATCFTKDGMKQYKDMANVYPVQFDITKSENIEALKKTVEKLITKGKGIKLWALVNNAGIAPIGHFDILKSSTYRQVMEINYFGVINLTKALLPMLKQNKYSRIINVSSMVGLSAGVLFSAYSASKHALEGLTRSMRLELFPWNIYVSNVNPGFMSTPLLSTSTKFALEEFQSAPTDIQEQYNFDAMSATDGVVAALAEDPTIVADRIIHLVQARYPVLNNYCGWGANIFRVIIMLPRDLLELFMMQSELPIGPKASVRTRLQM